jgi:hypothetical protein
MSDEQWTGKDLERSGFGMNFLRETERNTEKPKSDFDGLPTEIQRENLSNTRVDNYLILMLSVLTVGYEILWKYNKF